MIEGGDGESNYAYYALHKLHMLPSELMGLDNNERAFIYAAIDLKIEAEKRESEKIKRESRKGKRGRGRR